MKFIENTKLKCPICGYEHNYQQLVENNSFGMRDLDTRPPGMMRSLMHLMVKKCPKCNYASYDFTKPLKDFEKQQMCDEAYLAILNDSSLNFAIKKFMLASLLLEKVDFRQAGISYLRTAWLADDAKEMIIAKKMRSKAIKYLELSLKSADDENIKLIIVDLYRRIGMFDEASDLAKDYLENVGLPKYKQNILRYQIQLCEKEDVLDHTIPGNHNFANSEEEEDNENNC